MWWDTHVLLSFTITTKLVQICIASTQHAFFFLHSYDGITCIWCLKIKDSSPTCCKLTQVCSTATMPCQLHSKTCTNTQYQQHTITTSLKGDVLNTFTTWLSDSGLTLNAGVCRARMGFCTTQRIIIIYLNKKTKIVHYLQ
jgi:hypothetical protein